jgi:hypothetical protein
MNLKFVQDESLLATIRTLVQDEKKLIKQILEYLEEIETRQLYLDRGFGSMFAFCTDFLGYTPQEAQTRIQAMRLGKAVPEIKNQIESGQISLTVAAKVQGHIVKENKARKQKKESPMTTDQTKKIVEIVQNQSVRTCERLLFEIFPHHAEEAPETAKTISAETIRLSMNLKVETYEMLKELQALRAHAHPGLEFEGIIRDLCELGHQKWNVLKAPRYSSEMAHADRTEMRGISGI